MNDPCKILELARFCIEHSQGDHDIHFDYSPHISSVSFAVYVGGWSIYSTPDLAEVYDLKKDDICVGIIKLKILSFIGAQP